MVSYVGILTVKEGMRDEYVQALKASGMVDAFLKQEGSIYYTIAESIFNENQLVVTDGWSGMDTFRAHDQSEIVETKWRPLYRKYVENEESYLLQK